MPEQALVLLSGGLDSACCLAQAVEALGAENVITLSLLYGQKHSREIEAARAIAAYYGCRHQVVTLPDLFSGYGSTLVDADKEHPELTYQEISESFGVSPTYVPFRNGNLLSAAAALALVAGASYIYYGAHSEDARGFAYPDCTPEFNGAMANAIYVGTYHKVRLVTPLQWLLKKDIVKLAYSLNTPVHLTYSCYAGRAKQCGKCPTCVSRIEAFKQNRRPDPVEYEIEIEWEK